MVNHYETLQSIANRFDDADLVETNEKVTLSSTRGVLNALADEIDAGTDTFVGDVYVLREIANSQPEPPPDPLASLSDEDRLGYVVCRAQHQDEVCKRAYFHDMESWRNARGQYRKVAAAVVAEYVRRQGGTDVSPL